MLGEAIYSIQLPRPTIQFLNSRGSPAIQAILLFMNSRSHARCRPKAQNRLQILTRSPMRCHAGQLWTRQRSTSSWTAMASSTSLHSGAPSRCIISSSSKCRRTFLTTEANTEQLFSLAGNLSDDNGKMDPYRLSVWVSIASGCKVFMPTAKAILERYTVWQSSARVARWTWPTISDLHRHQHRQQSSHGACLSVALCISLLLSAE